MQKISIYLHQEIIDILNCFGKMNDVVNRLLEECINNGSIYGEMEKAPDRTGARRLVFFIRKDLISQLPRMSLRPIIYWFVENEIYNELGWKMSKEYGVELKEKINKQYLETLASLNKLNDLLNGKIDDAINIVEKNYYEIQ